MPLHFGPLGRPPSGLLELDWDDISEPGCYVLMDSGLLARIEPQELPVRHASSPDRTGPRVAKLSSNPRAPLDLLRRIAAQLPFPVRF